jgi:hypothetical protein
MQYGPQLTALQTTNLGAKAPTTNLSVEVIIMNRRQKRRFLWLGNFLCCVLLLISGSLSVFAASADQYEDDNTFDNATLIEITGTPQEHTIHARTDEDWLKFEAQPGYGYQIRIDNVGFDIDIALELYETSGNILIETKNRGFEGEGEQIDYVAQSEGIYSIKVRHTGFFGDNTGYSIRVNEIPPTLKPVESSKNITAGESSEILFELVIQAFNKPIEGKKIALSLTPDDSTVGLSVNEGSTDNNGQVNTVLTAPSQTGGIYTITATLENTTITAQATVKIVAASPNQLTVTAGDNQNIVAGTNSSLMAFTLVDKFDNPIEGKKILLNLTPPTAESNARLSVNENNTDNKGQISTVLTAPDKVGTYTITATLEEDSTITAQATVKIVAGPPTDLQVTQGGNQSLAIGNNSELIAFKLADAFGNAISGEQINLSLTLSTDDIDNITNEQLALFNINGNTIATSDINGNVSGLSNENGQISARLKAAASIQGSYIITASAEKYNAIGDRTNLFVTESLPDLPPLKLGEISSVAVEANGNVVNTTAAFSGGISVNDGSSFEQTATLTLNESVIIQGNIEVDNNHVGKIAEILVVAYHESSNTYYMLDSLLEKFPIWDGNLASLVPFRRGVRLEQTQFVDIYQGNIPLIGLLKIYFGYRLANGTIVYNGGQTISVTMTAP